MQKSEKAARGRRELDRRFAAARIDELRARPRGGWVRAVRDALGMSQDVLATRLGVTKANVAKLEKSELAGTISVGKLAELARAMDCQLVYALVPNRTLEQTVQDQATSVAATELGYVSTTMALEDQSIAADRQADLLAEHVRAVIERNRQWAPR